jgi:hypothetical protein
MKTLLSLFLLASFALTAGELTGKWSGKFDTTNSQGEKRSSQAYMNLKLEGNTVSGTAGPNDGEQLPIKDGKLVAEKLTFKVEMGDGGSISFDLVFNGDTIVGNATGTGGDGEKMSAAVDLKRVN